MNEMLKKEEVFLNDIRSIINSARQNAIRSVDFCRVQMYWHMGKRIYSYGFSKGFVKNYI